jgi:phosphotransferase system  glucose/maltose/N-acetylglucosamine-specific IIC component
LIDNITFFVILWVLIGVEILMLYYLIKTFLSINKKVDYLLIKQQKKKQKNTTPKTKKQNKKKKKKNR